jgi:hypothetical protein
VEGLKEETILSLTINPTKKITDTVKAMYEMAVSAGLTYNEMGVVISKLKKLVDDSIGNKVL